MVNKVNKMRFHNKAVVVTGGGTGIGFAIAKQLYKEGAAVAILGRRELQLQEAERKIEESHAYFDQCGSHYNEPNRFLHYCCDITVQQKVEEVFGNLKEKLRKLQFQLYGLVNNAGVPCRKNLLETTQTDLEQTFAVNFYGAVYCSQAAVRQMLENDTRGSIVNISSVGGLKAFDHRLPYNASKAALINSTESIAIDYAKFGIRVNSVCPGYARTEMTADFFDTMSKQDYDTLVSKNALGQLVRLEDIANEVCFLLSDDARSTTGAHRVVDCGWSLGK